MASAVHLQTDAPALPVAVRPGRGGAARAVLRRVLPSRLLRDPFLVYTAALAPIGLGVSLVDGQPRDLLTVGLLTPIFVGIQAVLGMVPARHRPLTPLGWSFLRLAVALLYVAGLAELVGGPTQPLASLFVPVVVAAAALGAMQAAVIGTLASLIYLAPELAAPGNGTGVALRGLALAGISILVAVGTRRLVLAVERTTRQLRSAMVEERRRSRQIAGMEAISRLLMAGGPTTELLDEALGVLSEQFHYHFVSIYLADGDQLRLGAQRGYAAPRESFDGSAGVVGRVMRSHEIAHVPDVAADLDYIPAVGEVVSEICAPLMDGGQFLGILNVEAIQPLDRTDRDLVATLAGRIASVVALGRDRQALAERVAVFRRLNEFTSAVGAELDLARLGDALVNAVRSVIAADIVSLTVLERESGRYLMRAASGADPSILEREIRVGEGLAGRAIRDRTTVFDPAYGSDRFPAEFREGIEPMILLGAGIPLIRDGVVVGALSIARRDLARDFQPIEYQAMELMASHAALALANAFLHAEVGQLAVRDPLTSLFNRRHFDASLDRMLAGWRRAAPEDRRPLAAIMFDLDRFGEFNKQHGHQVGDQVLRTFAAVLAGRFRDSDLVARFGGEEFVAILDGSTRDAAVQVAEEIRAALAARPILSDDGQPLPVTVSAGCAELDEAEPTREQLLRTADVALFMAKRAGRDRVVAA
jgi:diguanylate cyclase (GGDEF) domain